MRVRVAPEVFDSAEALTDLLILLRCFAQGRHDWVADDITQELARRYFGRHAPTFSTSAASLAEKGTVAAAWSDVSADLLIVDVDHCDLAEAVNDLNKPATLVVEDQESDGCFIRSIARALGIRRVDRAISEGWLRIEHGGGDRIVHVAKSMRSHFRLIVRVMALLDSDRLLPDQRTAAHGKAEALAAMGIVVHVLELREAENYVPNRVLARRGRPGPASRKIDLLRHMSPEQRGCFDMKTGFGPSTEPPRVLSEQQELYSRLPPNVLRGLRGGFGRDLLRRMDDTALTERDFAGLGNAVVSELRQLLATLSALI